MKSDFIQAKKEITKLLQNPDMDVKKVLLKALKTIQIAKLPDPDFDKAVEQFDEVMYLMEHGRFKPQQTEEKCFEMSQSQDELKYLMELDLPLF